MEPDPGDGVWDELGVPAAEVKGWKALGFEPFEAALANGDGFPPLSAGHYSRPLRKTAERLRRAGLDSAEGLRWHRAGFGATEAARWRSAGVDLDTAKRRRDGYDRPTGEERGPHAGR